MKTTPVIGNRLRYNVCILFKELIFPMQGNNKQKKFELGKV